jgi:hypothetical protein
MIHSPDRIRLHMDGVGRLSAALSGPTGNRVAGPLVFGALTMREFRRRATISEARLHGVREIARDMRVVGQATGDGIGHAAQCPILFPDLTPRADAIVRQGPGRV